MRRAVRIFVIGSVVLCLLQLGELSLHSAQRLLELTDSRVAAALDAHGRLLEQSAESCWRKRRYERANESMFCAVLGPIAPWALDVVFVFLCAMCRVGVAAMCMSKMVKGIKAPVVLDVASIKSVVAETARSKTPALSPPIVTAPAPRTGKQGIKTPLSHRLCMRKLKRGR